jgi:hypothetical protein
LQPQLLFKPSGSITIRTGGMAIRALDLIAKVSSRFVYEILPVTVASVIGAMLVNHYGRQPTSPPIVIQTQPSASEDAMVQSLREEHELIASFVKHNQEGELDSGRSGSAATQVASVTPLSLSAADPPLPEPRPAAPQKAIARLAPKAAIKKKPGPSEAPLPQPDPAAVAIEPPPFLASLPPPARIEPETRARPIIRVAGAFGGWVADVAQAPARVAFLPRWSDWSSMAPLIRPLSFFRQD